MAGRLMFVLYFFLVVPTTRGLRCFTCDGQTYDGGYDCCVNGSDHDIQLCPDAPEGEVSKCAKIVGYIHKNETAPTHIGKREVPVELLAKVGTIAVEYLPIVAMWIKRTYLERKQFVIRGCTNVVNSTFNEDDKPCTEDTFLHKLIGRSHQNCLCGTDLCNGQTTLVSSILSSFIGPVIYYVL